MLSKHPSLQHAGLFNNKAKAYICLRRSVGVPAARLYSS